MPQVSVQFGAGAFSAKLYVQPGTVAAVVPLTQQQMGSQDLLTAAAATTQVTGIIAPANQLVVQNVGQLGYSPASASFSIAGSRYNAKVSTASDPVDIDLTFSLNPSSQTFQSLTASSNSGTDVRTYCVSWVVGGNTFVLAFNAFVSAVGYEFDTSSEARATCQLTQQGAGQFGYSFI